MRWKSDFFHKINHLKYYFRKLSFLPAQRVGRNWIIKRKDVEAWIEAGRPNRRRKASHESDEDIEQPQDDGTGNNQ